MKNLNFKLASFWKVEMYVRGLVLERYGIYAKDKKNSPAV